MVRVIVPSSESVEPSDAAKVKGSVPTKSIPEPPTYPSGPR
jgi:hypothetical protein